MTARKPFTTIAAALFLLAAAVHLYRLFSGFQIVIGSCTVPQWASWVFAAVAALLGAMLLTEARKP